MQFLIFDDQQRATYPTGIRVDADLPISDVADHRDFRDDDIHLASEFDQRAHQLLWIAMDPDPTSVHEDLCRLRDRRWRNLFQVFHAPFFQKLQNRRRLRADRLVANSPKS